MKKVLQYLLVLVVVVGLGGVGIYEYQHRPTTESLQTALIAQRTLESEVRDLQTANAIANINLKNTQNALTTTTSQKTAACTALSLHKLTTTACQ